VLSNVIDELGSGSFEFIERSAQLKPAMISTIDPNVISLSESEGHQIN
jgi:hypothetical protein